MSAIPDTDLEGYSQDNRLIRVLYSLKGDPMPAVNVMEAIGLEFQIKRDTAGEWAVVPQTSYVRFIFLLRSVSRFFERHGFAVRFGGRPSSNVWIEQSSSS